MDLHPVFPDISDTETFEPREHVAQFAAALVEARAALGSAVVLGVDWHHRLSVAEAASFCQRMPSGTLDFIEEPIRDETPEAYEALAADDPTRPSPSARSSCQRRRQSRPVGRRKTPPSALRAMRPPACRGPHRFWSFSECQSGRFRDRLWARR